MSRGKQFISVALFAFALWIAYDFGESRGMQKIENFYATHNCTEERAQSLNSWIQDLRFALSPASGLDLTTAERKEIRGMTLIISRNYLPDVGAFCANVIQEGGSGPSYAFPDRGRDLFLPVAIEEKINSAIRQRK